jgi:CHASE3 domain sensor protein
MSDINFNAPVGMVNTGKVDIHGTNIGTQNNYYGTNPEAAALAQELDQLLQSLTIDPADPAAETETLKALDTQPTLKDRLINALKAGSLTAVEEICQNPLAKVAISALKAAFPNLGGN